MRIPCKSRHRTACTHIDTRTHTHFWVHRCTAVGPHPPHQPPRYPSYSPTPPSCRHPQLGRGPKTGLEASQPLAAFALPLFPETEPCSFFLFLPGLNKDPVKAESLKAIKPSIRVRALPCSPQAATLPSRDQEISWKTPSAAWSWLGAWVVKARRRVSGQSSRDSHSVNLTCLLHPTPSLASSCWDSKDGIGQTIGEKYKSQAWLRGLWIELLWQRTQSLSPVPQFPLDAVGHLP